MNNKEKLLDEIWDISKELSPEQKRIMIKDSLSQTTYPEHWHFDQMIAACLMAGINTSEKIMKMIMQGCKGTANPNLVVEYIEQHVKNIVDGI